MRIFTLIELLIVIAIIGILASILLPALNKAREQAKSIFCKNNLKQWGFCCMNYINDHDGVFPPWQWPVNGIYYYPIIGDTPLMKDYMLTKPNWMYYKSWLNTGNYYLQNKKAANLLSCPSAILPKNFGMDYGQNCFLGAASSGSIAGAYDWVTPNREPIKIVKIKHPASVMFWGESDRYFIYNNLTGSDGGMKFRHNKNSNMLFIDNHVDSMKYPGANMPVSTDTVKFPWL